MQDITIETILKGVEAEDIDEAVAYLISIDKNSIDKKAFSELANALSTIIILNKFDQTIAIKLDELLNFLRNECQT